MEVSPKGETIIDFGQNLAGVLRVKVDLPAGTKLILDHFETKDSQGNYFNNIAGADMTGHTQTDVYIYLTGNPQSTDRILHIMVSAM